jgi:putative Mg2+ transporter-C (MgtC) family protein
VETLNEHWLNDVMDLDHVGRVVVRLTVAVVLGAILGYERQQERKAAGLRTHILVALGTALFVLVPVEAGAKLEALMRVVQGIVAGIGFLGAGTILKLTAEREIHGLTTAANIWVTAAVGMAVGMGFLWPAMFTVILTLLVLYALGRIEAQTNDIQKK